MVFGESTDVLLGPDLGAIDVDVEDPARALDELGLDLKRLLQCVRQTGGSGKVVSLAAVFDADFHGCFASASLPVCHRCVKQCRRLNPSPKTLLTEQWHTDRSLALAARTGTPVVKLC